MSTVSLTDLSSLADVAPGDIDHLVVSASFEERAHGVYDCLHQRVQGKHYVCFNGNHRNYLQESVDRFVSIDRAAEVIELDSDDPHTTFEALRTIIEAIRSGGRCHLGIDLTGFTRESLAILLYLAKYRLADGSKVTAFYHRAERYGRTPKRGWLSQGIREVRSILGYAGQMRVTCNTELLLLAGFETERAQEIIDTIEPSCLSLGTIATTVPPGEEENPHNQHLKEFIGRIEAFYASASVSEFAFSSVDPIFTRDNIIRVAKASPRNVVLSCLNSKPAMVGACLAAMDYPMIQLIYAQPLFYNTSSYSEPSGKVSFFPVPM